MPVRTPTPRRPSPGAGHPTAVSNFLAGIVGGLVGLAVGATLIATGAINTDSTHQVVVRELRAAAATLAASSGHALSVADIYRRTAPGVVFVPARITTQTDSPFGFPLEQQ